LEFEIKCSKCNQPSANLLAYVCPHCGQPLDTEINRKFQTRRIREKDYSHWRYVDFFPYIKEKRIITLGEGWTPLVKFSTNVYFKLESSNPTGSFKDRGSTTLISAIHEHVEKAKSRVTEDSSGNAGASIAAYCARARLDATIYVPRTVSGPKFNQIKFYGTPVLKISGSRNKVAEEAQKAGQNGFYVGHLYHPLFRDGIRTLAYEIVEQSGWSVPKRIYLPVSAGTLLLGVLHGFKHLLASNVIDEMPQLIACQTRQVSPLYHRIKKTVYQPPKKVTSVADALASTNPPLLDLMAKQLTESNGDAVIVEENEILGAFKTLAENGFFVEPSSAVAYAAYRKQFDTGETSEDEKTVIILTGTGLKTALAPT
jgi:threonine synthase